jgi:hypothetical protein
LTINQIDTTPVEVRVTDFRTLVTTDIFDPYQRVNFLDVASSGSGVATLSLDYTNGLSSLQLLLDQDGNGSIDQTLPPTSVLDQYQCQDYSAPETFIQVAGFKDSKGFFTGPVIATITATDEGTGVLKTEYSLDNGQSWQVYDGPIDLIAEQTPVVLARSVDLANNQEYPFAVYRLRPFLINLPLIIIK